jgi:hypothetical protein
LVAKAVRQVPALGAILHHQHRRFGGTDFERDVSKFWWTSPLSAGQALSLERSQIEEKLGLEAMVSLSDHDNIEAPSQLQLLESNDRVPVSVEWTAPFGSSYFHLGVHNLPPRGSHAMMARLREATETRRPELGAWFAARIGGYSRRSDRVQPPAVGPALRRAGTAQPYVDGVYPPVPAVHSRS